MKTRSWVLALILISGSLWAILHAPDSGSREVIVKQFKEAAKPGAASVAPERDERREEQGEAQRQVSEEEPEAAHGARTVRIEAMDDDHFEPLAGVLLTLLSGPEPFHRTHVRALTDETGAADLPLPDDVAARFDHEEIYVLAAREGYASLIICVSSGDDGLASLNRSGEVHGRVIELETGRPIVGARLHFACGHAYLADETTILWSDEDGGYRYDGVPVQWPFQVLIVREGFDDYEHDFGPIEAASAPLDLLVPLGRSLSGVVVDAATGLEVATALVLGEDDTPVGPSSRFVRRGFYGSSNLWLCVTAPGYSDTQLDCEWEQLQPDAQLVIPLIPLAARASVSGQLLDEGGRPMPGVEVGIGPRLPDEIFIQWLQGERGWLPSQAYPAFDWQYLRVDPGCWDNTIRTGPDGRFRFDGLEDVPWSAWVMAEHPIHGSLVQSGPINVGNPGCVTDVTLRFAPSRQEPAVPERP